MKHIDFSQSVNVISDARALRDTASREGSATLYRRYGKRALDITFCLALLPALLPVIGLLMLLVRRDGGPGLYRHLRIGQDGNTFHCLKIRTMVTDSDARLDAHLRENPVAAAEWARDHKLTDDPRVTRIGNILRQTSLDELPQIWNVLKGDMSLVGPRPIVLDELARYRNHQAAYLAMKPGVTGAWQTTGRNGVTYDERVAMDVSYFHTMSLARDVTLMVKTALAVLQRTGK